MKMKLFLVALATAGAFSFTSCKKDKDEKVVTQNPQVEGYWTGKIGPQNTDPTDFYALLFRQDGTVRVFTGGTDSTTATKAEGSYKVANGAVSTSYPTANGTIITTATVTNNTTMDGTWGTDPSNSNGGKFAVTQR